MNPMSVAIFAFRHVDSDHETTHEAACASPIDATHVPSCVFCCGHASDLNHKDYELPRSLSLRNAQSLSTCE